MTTDKKWHSGPPPSIGWWPASNARVLGRYRWYNGTWWSMHVRETASAETAAACAKLMAPFQSLIKWQHRPDDWPERSRT